jgi:hypothetical protein
VIGGGKRVEKVERVGESAERSCQCITERNTEQKKETTK